MINGKRICVVMPAYNAAATLQRTCEEIPAEVVDEIILTDDCSNDETVALARKMGLRVFAHDRNRGYGANQKTCYREALRHGADIIVMLHPDYQYTPKLLAAMTAMIAYGEFDCCLGSRILGSNTLVGGMPIYKYASNRILTLIQNLALGQKISEYHTGYRAFTRKILETLPLEENSDDFAFDNQMLAQIFWFGFRIGEISCPCRYNPDSSSISFRRSIVYGLAVLRTSLQFRLARLRWIKPAIFNAQGRKLQPAEERH
jgi:glycosyltransferase involved in cell wall biosynthesis